MAISWITADPRSLRPYFLQNISLRRLGKFVVLAGPNGGGKSRTLNLVEMLVGEEKNRLHLLKSLDPDASGVAKQLGFMDGFEDVTVVRVTPSADDLTDVGSSPIGAIREGAASAPTAEVVQYGRLASAYVFDTLRKAIYAQGRAPGERATGDLEIRAKSLRELVFALLRMDVSIDENDQLLMGGLPLTRAGLSPGQIILFHLAAAIHAKEGRLDKTVLLLDEPENHLHPSALVQIVQRLVDATGAAQIWIATHSVPLIAHIASIDPGALHLVSGGVVSYAGEDPKSVLDGLLGGDEGIQQLHQLTGLPADFAMLRFAAQCLTPPGVVGHVRNDDQTRQVIDGLSLIKERPVRILDFGAGKGRLVEALADEMGNGIVTDVDYVAYDPGTDNASACTEALRKIYPSSQLQRLFHSLDDLTSERGANSFHLVVMCNVLHEISPEAWRAELGRISGLLMDGGYLVVVEDQAIKVGEMPHPGGFIVLDKGDLDRLFCTTDGDLEGILRDARRDGDRLTAHWIPASLIPRVSDSSVRSAISSARDRARRRIEDLRDRGDGSYKQALMHAFLSQQFVNASLYLDKNGGP